MEIWPTVPGVAGAHWARDVARGATVVWAEQPECALGIRPAGPPQLIVERGTVRVEARPCLCGEPEHRRAAVLPLHATLADVVAAGRQVTR
jgi:hypothetical protein